MKTTLQQKEIRAIRIDQMARELVEKVYQQIEEESILQSPDQVTVFAMACMLSILMGHQSSSELGSDLAGTALRLIIKNLMIKGVKIPELEMDGWVPPNIHWGNDRQH
jgi:hypothetical protein